MYFKPPTEIDEAALKAYLQAAIYENTNLRVVNVAIVGYAPVAKQYQLSVIYEDTESFARVAVTINATEAFIHGAITA